MQEVNGTTYHEKTNKEVIRLLELSRASKQRIRIWYGDIETGEAWDEENDVAGMITRSTGQQKIPLIISSVRSMGGPALLDHCIVRIDFIKDKSTAYQHPKFNLGKWEVIHEDNKMDLHPWKLVKNGNSYAGFNSEKKALRLLDFMTGNRYNK